MNGNATGPERDPAAGGAGALLLALRLFPVLVMLALGLILLALPRQAEGPAWPETLVGRQVPEFSLPPLDPGDAGLAAADLRGEVSVVNFWASWCAPCREEMSLLQELAGTGGVFVHGVNLKDKPAAARRFLGQTGNPYRRIGVDADGRLAAAWGVKALPATFVIDAEGRIVAELVGPLDRAALAGRILPAIAGARAGGG